MFNTCPVRVSLWLCALARAIPDPQTLAMALRLLDAVRASERA